ncbi:MAG: hypothetical protein OXG51_14810 [Gammaproteobacteria bacterium]|nr:hypothetical protein [Gammaproteobacteria bacterium]
MSISFRSATAQLREMAFHGWDLRYRPQRVVPDRADPPPAILSQGRGFTIPVPAISTNLRFGATTHAASAAALRIWHSRSAEA